MVSLTEERYGVYTSMFDIAARLSLFSAKIKTREMSKKAAPPVFRKVAWGRGLVGDPGCVRLPEVATSWVRSLHFSIYTATGV